MGNRSTVKFINRYGRNILSLYNQYDGYLTGVGKELLEFFRDEKNYGNGFEDTALLYVCFKKKGKAYNTYLTKPNDMQEFNYYIYDTDGGIRISVVEETYFDDDCRGYKETLYFGQLNDLEDMIKDEEDMIKYTEMKKKGVIGQC